MILVLYVYMTAEISGIVALYRCIDVGEWSIM